MDFGKFLEALKAVPTKNRPAIEDLLSEVVDVLFDQGEEAAKELADKGLLKIPAAYRPLAELFFDSVLLQASVQGEEALRNIVESGLDAALGEDADDVLG